MSDAALWTAQFVVACVVWAAALGLALALALRDADATDGPPQ